ncbi:unnamed protein product [Didymodactylos carnosus]|uniref:Uncharacterized protein n=1 Tax=Didymodactylos carnosus TaxID=1234261 RepID=A0A8S2RXZ8_9BILA|nr:unnamed protein product [Didymodactylos carnosus]CAF4195594.1 unnamed protein product [Didymodactylos carnosus]
MGNRYSCHPSCYTDKLDEDLSVNDYRYLMKQTHLTPEIIQSWYREFREVCPRGSKIPAYKWFIQQLDI